MVENEDSHPTFEQIIELKFDHMREVLRSEYFPGDFCACFRILKLEGFDKAADGLTY